MVALSFVRSADDMWQARQILTEIGAPNIPLIAKIERPEALDHLEDILKVSQGVMVARGDLGLEMPLEKVPTSQKEITRKARRSGIPVIVATQVLESMRLEPRPTRAEVSDAANAVDDGVDAIMLAGETAVGLYPVRTVETLDAVIREAERIGSGHTGAIGAVAPIIEVPRAPHVQALCEAAVTLADHCNAFAIVAVTRLGNAARVLSALRPRTPIFASTETDVIARQLTLYRGVTPLDDRHRERRRYDRHAVEAGAERARARAERVDRGVHERERAARARGSEFGESAEIRVAINRTLSRYRFSDCNARSQPGAITS